MKKIQKRLLVLVLATIMALGCVACGSGDKDGNKKDPSQTNNSSGAGSSWEQVLANMPAELRGTTITVYNWNPITEYPGGASAIKEFTELTGIEVEWKTESFETYLSKLGSMVASGKDVPDVARLRTPLVSNYISMQPITATGFDFSDDAWDKWTMDAYTVNGNTYGVTLAGTHLATPGMICYNKSLITKYDLEDPYTLWKNGQWTYDKFVQIMKDFKAETNADYVCSYDDYSELTSMFGVTGPVSFDGTQYVSALDDNEFVSATQKIMDLKNTDYLLGRWAPEEFDSGKILFWAGSAIYARRQNAYFETLKSAGSLQVVPYPTVEGKEEYVMFRELEAYGIPKGADNAEAVPYFLRFFLDRTNYDLTSFFCSNQALEVYDHCMNVENKQWTTLYGREYKFYDNSTEKDEFDTGLTNATGAQVLSVLDSTASIIDQRVKRYNEQLEALGE